MNSSKRVDDKVRIATVFSGIGSAEFALKRMGVDHKVVFACDSGEVDLLDDDDVIFDKLNQVRDYSQKKALVDSFIPKSKTNFVKKSYLANYLIREQDYHHNVKFLDGNQYKNEVDIFVGGSPCQSFTLFGYQKGLEEARGTLFYEFARLIKEIEPKAFIYENVQGLVKHDKGKTWEVVKRVFHSLDYEVYCQVINAADYGIPQNRRRIFIVGFKKHNNNFEFPKPIKLEYKMQDFLIENTKYGNFHNLNGSIILTKESGEVESKYFLSDKILPGIMSHGTNGFKMKPEIDLEIARPLMSTMHKMHRAGVDNYVTTSGRIRRLTPRECLRLMGYTDDFEQVVSDTQMYRQAGNSVVVDVLMALMKEILKKI